MLEPPRTRTHQPFCNGAGSPCSFPIRTGRIPSPVKRPAVVGSAKHVPSPRFPLSRSTVELQNKRETRQCDLCDLLLETLV